MSIELLIPIVNHTFENGEEIPTVNARDLHAWLEVKTQFSKWIQRRIEEYKFAQNVDFILSQIWLSSETNSYTDVGNQIDYFISLGMAKELAMVERTPKGKEARLYFIACEKQARSNKDYLHQNQALKQELLKANPKWRKILYCYRLGLSQRNTAKILGVTQECVWRHLARMKTCGLIKATKATPLHLPLLVD